MKKLIFYEWKKIFGRRFNVVVMLAGYLLIVICAVNWIRQRSFYTEEMQEYVYGTEAFQRSQEANKQLTQYLTEEYLTELVEEIQSQEMDLETDDAYLQILRPRMDILYVLCSNYMDMGEYVSWNRLNEISTEGGIGFYERRIQKVENFLNQSFSYGDYSEEEKAFWLEKEQEVTTPFRWGDKDAMSNVWDAILIAFYLLFAVAVCISPVFASEYESGACALLLTTRYGKTRLIYVKILAAVMFTLGYVVAGIGIGVGIIGIAVGFSGADLPVQLWGTVIPYDWTVGEACWVTLAMLLLIALTVGLFTCLLSSRMKSSMITLVITFTLLIGPAFLPMSKESRLWNQINYLFPVRVMQTRDMLGVLNSYQFGSMVLSYLGMAVIVYLLVGIISFCGIPNGFAGHQVKN